VSAEGRIQIAVWPAHIGFGETPDERVPQGRRAQIQWRVEGGKIVGGARVWVPEGVYPYLLYYQDLDGPPSAVAQFAHPFFAPHGDWVDVDPIENNDPAALGLAGVARYRI